jgi:hypothetical protein
MIKTALAVLSLAASVSANCDNSCSGHGVCLMDDVCSCYDNWGVGLTMQSGDCSDRICPFEIAWVDTPNANGKYHRYAECAGRGICNRGSGLCECFDGYEGEACHRTSCPNQCSGHGTCEYIEDMPFMATYSDYSANDFRDDAVQFNSGSSGYKWWDAQKTRGCVCDPQYTDADCSKRLCPYGTDILADVESLTTSQKYHIQKLVFSPENKNLAGLTGKTFSLTFISRLNETFTTIPIVFDDPTGSFGDFENDIRLALLHLPNQVIDDVSVKARRTVIAGGSSDDRVEVTITFSGAAVQGPQNLIVVNDYECSAGCTPRITGLGLETVDSVSRWSNISTQRLAVYNSYECGRRGKCDYTSGLCECFEGYTGENCNTLTTLV